jgi:hypothetical protein
LKEVNEIRKQLKLPHTTDNILYLYPILPIGNIKEKTLPKLQNNGYPGGWGIPRVKDEAIISPVSSNATDGA